MGKEISNTKVNRQPSEKRDVILVWLDFGPYSYYHLGVISKLSKLKKFDFIGIINTKQDMNFFENQKFVKFKKLIYYPECYIGKSTYDINNLKKIEEEFDLKLWLDIFAERSFYKFWTTFHKFTRKEILIIVENSLLFFNNILEKEQPKIILMQQAGENISNLLLYRLAKKRGIEILMPVDIHYKDHIHISNNLTSNEITDEFEKRKNDFNEPIEKYDEEFLKNRNYVDILKTISSFDSGINSFSQKINHYVKRLLNNLEPTYINIGKSRFRSIKHRLNNYFEIKKREKFLDNNAIKEIKDEKFLYFPLQSEPEASILVNTPFYSNQLTLIEIIAKAIPINSILYVKEHPLQKIKLWRSIGDYKKIIEIPNVKLLHPSMNAQEILKNSQGVISISGATGFEALFYQKPVILFGDDHYDKLSMVTKIQTINDLPKKVKNALLNFKFNEKEFSIYMKTLKQFALPIPYYSILKEGVSVSSIQRNGQEFNLTNLYFQKFYEKYDKYFKLIADTIFLRVQKIPHKSDIIQNKS
jgi:hypothetical protein